MVDIYGIKNCGTMKKAIVWLSDHNVEFIFHDYKKEAVDEAVLNLAIKQHGWESVINRRGNTWRNLSDEQKHSIDAKIAVQIAIENPSIIKRPLLVRNKAIHLGFKMMHIVIFLGKISPEFDCLTLNV
ncbi:MAG: Spx/MgsR family RNA polymerase-binding regulatory protein [Robiginitomaculum sp.]|nr:Spx/MgsR family RNA polymerase-binding regulatory protein [Robiginitomaculum sp.]